MAALPPTADCIFITGPTASGKTAVGVALAKMLGAEVISMDSMALYRGMNVGTAKPSPEEQAGVPHHLLDVIKPEDDFSVAQYVEAAETVVSGLRERNVLPLFVGGTPLYLKALLRGLFEGPPADWEWRKRLSAEAENHEPRWLHAKLMAVDAPSAKRLHPNDARRLIRALEVYEKTGQPISRWQQQFDRGRPAAECSVYWLDRPPEVLAARIEHRVDEMFANGLVDEVLQLTQQGRTLSHTATQALGYREVLEHMAAGPALPETMELVKTHTRQFAKRQRTWFRGLSECRRLELSEEVTPQSIAEKIASELS